MIQQNIPVVHLGTSPDQSSGVVTRSIMDDEIKGIQIESITLDSGNVVTDEIREDSKAIYLFLSGDGAALINRSEYPISPETILLPNSEQKLTIENSSSDPLLYVKILCHLSDDDQSDMRSFPVEHTQQVYHARFDDCQAYTEPIKSPNTISRTILPNKIIPRVAMGTVQTTGPDAVGAHKHPMLDQLFLGLSDNQCTVHADGVSQIFGEYDLLHIPLGSTHSVEVAEQATMYYIWMDFFLHIDGEEWLDTHIVDEES